MDLSEADSRKSLEKIFDRAIFYCLILVIVAPSFSIAVHSIGFGAAFILWAMKMVMIRRWELPRTPFDYFFLFYAVAEILSTIFSLHAWESFLHIKRLLLIGIVYLSAASLKEEWKLKTLLGTLFCITAFLSLFEIGNVLMSHEERLNIFQHYMTTGGLKMIVSLLILPFLLDKSLSRKMRYILTALFVPIFVALVLTQTRSSWLGFLCGAIAIGFIRNRSLIFVVLVFALLFVLFAPSTLHNRALSIVDPHHPSNSNRLRMWETGWRIFCDHPVFGIGDTDIKQTYIQYTTPIDVNEGGHLHNNFVMLAVTLGIVGFSAVMAIFVRIILYEFAVFRKVLAHPLARSVVLGAMAVFIGFQVNGLFEWNFGDQEIVTLFWFSAGITVAVARFAQRDITDEREIITVS